MFVKRLHKEEVLEGLHLVWEVFAEANAPHMTPEGVAAFQRFIRMEHFMPAVESGEMAVYGAVEDGKLAGVCAVRADGHLSLLFVKKESQRQGAAGLLIQESLRYCAQELRTEYMTVHAAPQAIEAYRHMGFYENGVMREEEGIRYQPMKCAVGYPPKQHLKTGRKKSGMIPLIVSAVILLLVGISVLTGKIMFDLIKNAEVIKQKDESLPFAGELLLPEEPEQIEKTGIDGILCFEEENLPYTIQEEHYAHSSDGENGEYPMEFDIVYPQIEGMEGDAAEEINRIWKACAMSTADTLYLNPSEAIKEAMMQEESPFMASQVRYKVTYAGKDFISVVFTDQYYVGNVRNAYQDLRTRNIRVSDASEYRTADLVKLNPAFMKDWLGRMKKEAPDAGVLEALKMSQFRRILNGEILENCYYDNFFVDQKGMEIGMTYHYTADAAEESERGWITAPFLMKELAEYRTDSDFWKLIETND